MKTKPPDKPKREYSTQRDRLKAIQVGRLTEPGLYHDGGGLYLQVSKKYGTRSWVFRYRLAGKMREMGLGSFDDFTLAEARIRANESRQLVADKIDPIDERDARARALTSQRAKEVNFKKCAEDYHEKESVNWKNAKHIAQWINSLRTYAFPRIGTHKVHTIGKAEILSILEPIWSTKPETAGRVLQRIHAVLEWAAARDLYPGYSPVMWKQIDTTLGANRASTIKTHHAACPYREVGSVIKALHASASYDLVKLAFEFTVLTAARSGETRGALWSEVDWQDRIWAIPAARMKAGKDHRVPLSKRCVEILKAAKAMGDGKGLVFRHPSTGKPYSDAVFTSLLHKGLGLAHTMHGFRSTFRDWGSEKTDHARELLEVSLAHLPGDGTEHAYWRGDVIERRRTLMEDWATFVAETKATGGG